MPYACPWLSLGELLDQLIECGMTVNGLNAAFAIRSDNRVAQILRGSGDRTS